MFSVTDNRLSTASVTLGWEGREERRRHTLYKGVPEGRRVWVRDMWGYVPHARYVFVRYTAWAVVSPCSGQIA